MKPAALDPSPNCYGCSQKNPVGLALKIERDGDACVARFLPGENHVGWQGMLHGGVIAALLDEIMGWALWCNEVRAVTGSMSVRYSQPAPIGAEIELRGWITERSGRKVETCGELRSASGALVAEAKGLYIIPASPPEAASQ